MVAKVLLQILANATQRCIKRTTKVKLDVTHEVTRAAAGSSMEPGSVSEAVRSQERPQDYGVFIVQTAWATRLV